MAESPIFVWNAGFSQDGFELRIERLFRTQEYVAVFPVFDFLPNMFVLSNDEVTISSGVRGHGLALARSYLL